jgi:hypothetical protein
MKKLSIRDLVLVSIIVATLAAWWIDRTRLRGFSKYTEQEMGEMLSAKNQVREVDAELRKRGLGVHIQRGRVVILPENGTYAPNYSVPPTPVSQIGP